MQIHAGIARVLRGMEFIFLLLLGLTVSAYAGKLKEYLMPSETCAYIVDSGDQFKVTSKTTEPPDISASDNGDQGAVAPYKSSYPANVSCEITFRTEPNKQFFMRMTHFEIQDSVRCQKDALRLYNGPSAQEGQLIKTHGGFGLCGLTLSLPNYFYSTSNEVTLKFVTDGEDNNYGGFTLLLSPFWLPEPGSNCTSKETQCKLTRKCLTRDVQCNGVAQCEDASDEPDNCQYLKGVAPHRSLSYTAVIALALLVTLALVADGPWSSA